ncbi:TcpQ domain-containing protein [Candidimonas sp. SYP-B2681]|uniref:TcpQ domain-containing protein n=1 Tax=Candidimonas sp. SYP-B2681 TaxID=2497686 RepID=UPI001315770B|nr:TcpQ domain-containing protein [Candidimonas sp. SYP-B2681]
MFRMLFVSVFSGLLSACSGMPDLSLLIPATTRQVASSSVHFSFAWRLSGDRGVAPLQVFDDGRRTWLQFLPEQPLPAVFEHTSAGDRPLSYKREGPYMVLQGIWPKLILRGGHLKTLVEQLNNPAVDSTTVPAAAITAAQPAPLLEVPAPTDEAKIALFDSDASMGSSREVAIPSATAPGKAGAPALEAPSASSLTSPSFELSIPDSSSQNYAVSPQDLNLRSALTRWARSAGWTFEPEHWAVDADIPIVGSATFEPGFKLAVQELVASTELADRPLQPCFYSNRVLRIVPYAQQCDRTVSGAGTS